MRAFCLAAIAALLASTANAIPYSSVQALSLGDAAGLTTYIGAAVSGGTASVNNVITLNSTNAKLNGTTGFAAVAGATAEVATSLSLSTIQFNGTVNSQTGAATIAQGTFAPAPSFAGSPAQAAVTYSTANTAIRNTVSTIEALTPDATFSTGGSYAAGQNGYNVIDVSSTLSGTLNLTGKSASDYFFVYLENGIGSTGAITLTGPVSAANVIVAIGGSGGSTIGTNTAGTYLVTNAGNVTLNAGVTLTGGFFLANTTTTTEELILNAGATIVATPWSGYVTAAAPEPASFTLLLAGIALLLSRRRKPRQPSARA